MKVFSLKFICLQLVALLLLGATPAHAQLLCSLGLRFNCSSYLATGDDRVSSNEIADGVIANPQRAAANMNNYFQVVKWNDPAPGAGYVRVTFNFEGSEDPATGEMSIYQDTDQQAHLFLNRSIVDWARSLFVSEQRTYVVTVSATDRSSGNTFWVEPIMAFDYSNGFNLIQVNDDLAFNGNSRFFTRATDEIELSIEVKHAVTADLPEDIVTDIFDAAGALARLFSQDIVSIVESASVKNITDTLKQRLSRFETSRDLSRTIVAQMAEDKPVGMRYHFLAPEVNYTPFILHVGLEYKESLLSQFITNVGTQSELSTSNVMTSFVKPRNSDNVQSLAAYFSSHPTSTDASTILASPTGSTVDACRKIATAAAEIFEPRDVAIALLAYITENIDKVADKPSPNCFTGSDRLLLSQLNLSLPDEFVTQAGPSTEATVRPLRPIRTYFGEYLEALAILIKYDQSSRPLLASSISDVSMQAAENELERAFVVEDPDEMFVPGSVPRRIFPTDIINALLGKTFEHAGCWERSIHSDVESDPNIIGMLFGDTDALFEARVHFEAATPTNVVSSDIKVSKIVFSAVDEELLAAYESAYDGAACGSGWAPWAEG